jgi:signal transduction histidine kinase
MRLRTILLVLSLLAFFFASTAGYLYFSSSRQSALREADRNGSILAETLGDRLSSYMDEFLKSAKALSGLPAVTGLFASPSAEGVTAANAALDHFQKALEVDVCYLMDRDGTTIASSNRNDPDSFVGENYAFRPYFRKAVGGQPWIYLATGVTSGKRGVYYSQPVRDAAGGSPMGVLVIKASVALIEREILQAREGIVALVEPLGLIFVTNRRDWLYRFLWKPSQAEVDRIILSRQFGYGPFEWTGLERGPANQAFDASGKEYAVYMKGLEKYPGWSIVYLQDTARVTRKIPFRVIRWSGIAVLSFCCLMGIFIFILYRKASFHSRDLESRVRERTDELRRLSASIMSRQEAERTAIARELHDELGQMLTALRFEAVWMHERFRGREPNASERAMDMCGLIEKSIDDVRGLSARLRPGVLDDLGLIAALEWYTADFEKRTGVACSFSHSNVDEVHDTLATATYRIAQEALTNVARHARASRARVDLVRWDGFLTLSVTDNGTGFDAGVLKNGGSFGLMGMRERSNLAGGSLEIHSRPGNGTEVIFRVPCSATRRRISIDQSPAGG